MSWQNWAQLLGLVMVAALVLPAVFRLRLSGRKLLIFIAIWLGIFALAGLLHSLVFPVAE